MKYFQRVSYGIDVNPIALALARQPELWNTITDRRSVKGTAHLDTSDIWLRFNSQDNRHDDTNDEIGSPEWREKYDKFVGEHHATWYAAYYKLPQVRKLIFQMMALCEGVELGGVLITRIPAGKSVLPHADHGWHPHHYNTKIYIPLETNGEVYNRCENETVVMNLGEAWYFNNEVEHEVINNGTTDRITLIICIRCEG